MEIISVLLIVFGIILVVKLFSAGLYILSIPIKLIFLVLFAGVSIFVLIPLGIFSGLFSILLIPFAILMPFLPVLLIIFGIILLIKHSN